MSTVGKSTVGTSILLKQTESPEGLVFYLRGNRKRLAVAAVFALGPVAAFTLRRNSGMEVPLGLLLLAAVSLAVALRPRKTQLRVTPEGITATNPLGGSQPGTLQLPWASISELHYAPPGHGEIGGLYVREGAWCSRCILPRISEPQAEQVIFAIAEHYPSFVPYRNKISTGATRPVPLAPVPQPPAPPRLFPVRRSR